MAITDLHKRRRGRNFVLAGVLFGMVVLFFAITIARMGAHVSAG